MDQIIKSEWVAALRSGGLKQGFFRLNKPVDDTYCCLGVLCEIAVEAGVVEKKDMNGYATYDGSGHCLPSAVCEWAGLDKSNPQPKNSKSALISLNDNKFTFNEIADVIEKGF